VISSAHERRASSWFARVCRIGRLAAGDFRNRHVRRSGQPRAEPALGYLFGIKRTGSTIRVGDRSAWRSGNSDISRLLQNSLRWVLRDQSPVRVAGSGVVELFAWQTEPGFALHVMNYSNPNMTRPWVRDYYPIGAQRVTMELLVGVKATRVELLRAERKIEHKQVGRLVEFTIPNIRDFEVAALRVG
jgi:hypothetical protein